MKFKLYNPFALLRKCEWALWICSFLVVLASSLFSGSGSVLNTIVSLIGVTALIFVARGDAFGQLLTIIFSILYGMRIFLHQKKY